MSIKNLLYIIFSSIILCCSQFVFAQQQDNKNPISNETINIYTYPNPVSNKLTIRFTNTLKQQVNKVEIVNIIGKKLREQQVLDKNTTELTFNDLEEMPQGIYLIIAKDEYGKIIQSNKFLINR